MVLILSPIKEHWRLKSYFPIKRGQNKHNWPWQDRQIILSVFIPIRCPTQSLCLLFVSPFQPKVTETIRQKLYTLSEIKKILVFLKLSIFLLSSVNILHNQGGGVTKDCMIIGGGCTVDQNQGAQERPKT